MHQQDKEAHDNEDTDEAEFFGNHGEQEIGVGLRKVEQLFDAGAQTDAEPLTAAKGNQCVRELVTLTEGILPGIHETEDALAPIGRQPDQQHEANQGNGREQDKQATVHATEKQHAEGDGRDDDEGTEVRLAQEQKADAEDDRGHGQETATETAHGVQLARRVIGGIENGEQLHQLRWLQVDGAERQPALGAVDRAADVRDQHHHQQSDAGEEQPRRQRLPKPHRHLKGSHCRHGPDGQEDGVAEEEIVGLMAGEATALGRSNRG